MKVAIFVDSLSATGVVRNALAIAERLIERGCDVQLIAAHAGGVMRDALPREVSVAQLLPSEAGQWPRPLRLLRSVAAYREALRAFRPAVLLSTGNHGHLITALVAGVQPGFRTVFRISNDIDHMIGSKPESAPRRFLRRTQFRLIAAVADRLVLVSPHLLRNPAILSHSHGKAVVIPNGVDAAAVRLRAAEDCPHPWLTGSGSEPVAIAIGRFVRQKNFSTLLDALALARQTKPLRLILIGSGPLSGVLRRQADRLGLAQSVDFIAEVGNPMPYLVRSSVAVIPSWWEGASNVLLEALACGVPVVASRTAGNAEQVLDHGRYGVLVDPADKAQMARALLSQASDHPVTPGNRAEAFSRDTTLAAYADLIMEVESRSAP